MRIIIFYYFLTAFAEAEVHGAVAFACLVGDFRGERLRLHVTRAVSANHSGSKFACRQGGGNHHEVDAQPIGRQGFRGLRGDFDVLQSDTQVSRPAVGDAGGGGGGKGFVERLFAFVVEQEEARFAVSFRVVAFQCEVEAHDGEQMLEGNEGGFYSGNTGSTHVVVGREVSGGIVAVLHLSRQRGLGFLPRVSGAAGSRIEEVERGVRIHIFGNVSRELGVSVVTGCGSLAIGEQGGCFLSHYFLHVRCGIESFEGVCRLPAQGHACLVVVLIRHARVGAWTVGIGSCVRVTGVIAGGCCGTDASCAQFPHSYPFVLRTRGGDDQSGHHRERINELSHSTLSIFLDCQFSIVSISFIRSSSSLVEAFLPRLRAEEEGNMLPSP